MSPFTSRRRSHPTPCRSSDARRRRRGQPRLERLEDRTVLDAVTWTGADAPADPFWSDPNNWSPHVPGGGDDVFFTGLVDGQTVPSNSVDNVSLVLRSLTVDSTYGNGSGSINVILGVGLEIADGLTFNSGSIGGNGRVSLDIPSVNDIESGNIIVGPGGWTNDGVLTLGPTTSGPAAGPVPLAITNGSVAFAGGTFRNIGTITQTSTTVSGPTNCNVVNEPGAVYAIESDGTIGDAAGTFTNSGTFEKSAGTGTSTVGSFFVNNGGTIVAQSGTLVLSSAASFAPTSTFENTSTFQPAAGAVIDIAGTGTAILDGTLTGSGAGQVVVNGANAPTLEIGDATHAGATLNFPAGLFQFVGSDGGAPFVVGDVSGGTAVLTNDGSVTLDTTAGSISLGGGSSGGAFTVDNQATITQTGTNGVELGQGDIVNERSAVYDIQSDGTVTGSTGTLTNQGTLEKSGGTGTSTVASAFVNDGGTIVAQSGTLALSPASMPTEDLTFLSTSTFQPAAGTVIDLGAGTAILDGTWTGSGAGVVTASQGNLQIGESTQAGAALNFPSGLFQLVGSSGGGTPGINGNFAGDAAVLTNLGFVTFNTTAGSFDLGAVGGPLTFYNQGTITQTGANGVELGQANIVNEPGALYEIESDGTVTTNAPASDAAVTNLGTLLKAAGTGTATIQVLANQGTVEVQSGTLSITTDSNNIAGNTLIGGTWDVSAGAALIFSSGADLTTNDGNITLSGAGASFANINNLATNDGSFIITSGRNFATSGSLANNGTVTVGPASILSIGGNYTQGAPGTLDLELGGAPATAQFGQLDVQGSAGLAGTLEVGLVNGYIPGLADDFTVARYTTHTGNFASLQLPLTSSAGFQAAVGGTNVILDASALIALSNVPANISVEATGPAGAVVTYTTPTVTDLVDPNPTLTTTPASGSTFPLGTTTVTVTATDHSGNTTSAHFTINVQDTTPPVISNVPPNQTVEATGPAGAVVSYASPTAADLVDANPTITTTPASGSTFPLGTNTVIITATDHSGNTTSAHFTIDVQDTTPPVLANVPVSMTVEATGPAGAVVTYASPTATDLVDPHPIITATPPSGSTFPLGSTTVTVTATDHAGNTTSAHFTVDVQDTTPPVLANVPANLTVTATGPSGAVVTYPSATATDLVDPHPTIAATPPSGSTFPVGTTTVTVTATDPSGNAKSANFTVTVVAPTPTPTPPQVVEIASVQSRRGLTAFIVVFNEPLNSGSASNPGLYHVFAAVKKRGRTVFTRAVAIKGIHPGSAGGTVTINLARPEKGKVEATIQGTIMAANGASSRIGFSTII